MRIPTNLRNKVFERDGNVCVVCGRRFPLEIAHIIPHHMGGQDAASNLVSVCANCNRALDGRVRYLDFEETLRGLLSTHPEYRNVKGHTVVPADDGTLREVDISGERRAGGAWQPIRIECKLGGLTTPRLEEVKGKMLALRGGGAVTVLALASDLPAEHLRRLTDSGIEVWTLSDIATRFGSFLPPDRKSVAATLIREHAAAQARASPEQLILQELKSCARGKPAWSLYQQLVGRLLTHLFCPPLQMPAAESADATKENRRDYVFPNYADAGFWCFLRQQYAADFVVVDAKNYTTGVKKRDVLQVAHYLKAHGAGLFSLIVSRCAPAQNARGAAREAWISQRKLVLFLDDNDVETMVLAKVAGREAELLVRQKLEDFRLSL
ncbi:HNH endonuclease signature motif containing protein [Sorangium sp. So ce302]|uniref:HNH endonuclease n=1 Tax=Sorangium sp. So ce302 TaxID=3133297 RepID=UPI003F5FF1C8